MEIRKKGFKIQLIRNEWDAVEQRSRQTYLCSISPHNPFEDVMAKGIELTPAERTKLQEWVDKRREGGEEAHERILLRQAPEVLALLATRAAELPGLAPALRLEDVRTVLAALEPSPASPAAPVPVPVPPAAVPVRTLGQRIAAAWAILLGRA
jgi:hypothetical protein